jgi:hypothetical protein
MNKCDTCLHAKWVEVKEENENYNERYKRIAQTEQFKESYCGKSLGKEESESEDLEEEITKCYNSRNDLMMTRKQFGELIHHFAEWQKQKDQETIELAEDHAMLARMNKMKEEMMKDAVEGRVQCGWGDGNKLSIKAMFPQDSDLKYADKVKF